MDKLSGKIALITGAAVGLGEGIAQVYAKYGAKLCLFDLDPHVEVTAQKLRDYYHQDIISFIGDVSNRQDLEEAVTLTLEKFGSLDIACCNAGICRLAPFDQMSDQIRDQHIDVNRHSFFCHWRPCGRCGGSGLCNDKVSSCWFNKSTSSRIRPQKYSDKLYSIRLCSNTHG